jgi:probable rRNA maturation factor
MVTVNKAHLNRDYVTDVITYNYGDTTEIEGDVYICTEKVKENAIDYNQPFDNELKLVIVHSILHLLDYRDYTDNEKKEMYTEQERILSLITNDTIQ